MHFSSSKASRTVATKPHKFIRQERQNHIVFDDGARSPSSIESMAVSSAASRCFYQGQPVTLDKLLSIFASDVSEEVVFVGENHEHAQAQRIELCLLEALWLNCRRKERPLVLSLEFLDRSQQQVLDEALARDELEGIVPEPYLPLVRFARSNQVAVLAANAPRHITGQVARKGQAAVMDTLLASERRWCAPIPWPAPSDAYRDAFYATMQQLLVPEPNAERTYQERLQRMYQAQSLWDATMAYSIAESLERHPHAQVMHVTGFFHVAKRLGTVEILPHYRSGVSTLVGIIYPEALADTVSVLDGDMVIFAP